MTITLPSQVTALRKAHRRTQRELADLLGTTESTIGRLERERATLDTRWSSHLTLLAEKMNREPKIGAMSKLRASLAQALRYIEVQLAYESSMTAEEVERRVKANSNISRPMICANSVTPLAEFDFVAAREALAASVPPRKG